MHLKTRIFIAIATYSLLGLTGWLLHTTGTLNAQQISNMSTFRPAL